MIEIRSEDLSVCLGHLDVSPSPVVRRYRFPIELVGAEVARMKCNDPDCDCGGELCVPFEFVELKRNDLAPGSMRCAAWAIHRKDEPKIALHAGFTASAVFYERHPAFSKSYGLSPLQALAEEVSAGVVPMSG